MADPVHNEKLKKFIEESSQRGYQFAYGLCGNEQDAKELVQEAFYRVMTRWDQYDESLPLENWFLTILRNVYMDGVRRYEKRHGVSLDAPLSEDDEVLSYSDVVADARDEGILDQLEKKNTAGLVREALGTLKAEYKAILNLCDMQGLKYEEIARVMDCPLGTVRSRMNRARAAFKRAILKTAPEVQNHGV